MAPRQTGKDKERDVTPCLGKRQKLMRNRHVVDKSHEWTKHVNAPKSTGRLTWNVEKRLRGAKSSGFRQALGEWANPLIRNFEN